MICLPTLLRMLASLICTASFAVQALASQGQPEPKEGPQVADAMAPSDPDISLEAMTQAAFLSAPRLSPDGSMLGHFVSRDDKRMLAIVDSDSGKMIRLFGPADGLGFTRWRWAGNRRVLIHGSFWSLGSLLYGGIPFTTTEVFDLDTGKSSFVGFKDQGFEGDDILHVDPAGRFVLLSVSKKFSIRRTSGAFRWMDRAPIWRSRFSPPLMASMSGGPTMRAWFGSA